jgi:hypothetical protein
MGNSTISELPPRPSASCRHGQRRQRALLTGVRQTLLIFTTTHCATYWQREALAGSHLVGSWPYVGRGHSHSRL